MKNIILKYYFKITALCVFSVFLFGCSGLKVMIETEQPEDDFLVQCVWSSKNFKIHGGKYEVKRNIFVTSSDEIIDCGTSFWGVGPSVYVTHPLYMGVSGCESKALCNSPYFRFDGEIIVMLPFLKEKYLDELIKNYKGEILKKSVSRLGSPPDLYIDGYSNFKKFNVNYFRKKYNRRLMNFWDKLLPIVKEDWVKSGVESEKLTVENIVDKQWGGEL